MGKQVKKKLPVQEIVFQLHSCFVFRQQFGYFFFAKRVKRCAILSCSTKTTQPRPQDLSVAVPFSGYYPVLLTSFLPILQKSSQFGQRWQVT